MSMINDALKRAKEAQRQNIPTGLTPIRPLEARRKERDFNVVLPALIVLLVIAAIFFVGLAMAKHTVKKIVAAPAISATQPVETTTAPAPAPVPAPTPAAPVMVAEPAPAVIGPAAINTDAAPIEILVQGIVNDPVHPWAIVNGKTIYVGDTVNGMRVTAIARNSITLTGNGRTNRLFVGLQ